ncbi:hypothetical protein Ancab_023285 [Ancistrocladus abbreviatus]
MKRMEDSDRLKRKDQDLSICVASTPSPPTPTPMFTPTPTLALTPCTPSLVVQVPIALSLVPCTTTLALRPVSLMLDSTTTGSFSLDHLIDEVEMTSHIDVSTEGNAIDAEIEIDDLAAIEGGEDDDARAVASSSYSS